MRLQPPAAAGRVIKSERCELSDAWVLREDTTIGSTRFEQCFRNVRGRPRCIRLPGRPSERVRNWLKTRELSLCSRQESVKEHHPTARERMRMKEKARCQGTGFQNRPIRVNVKRKISPVGSMPTPFLVSAFSPTCFERAHSIRESVVFLCSLETFFSSPLWFHVLVVTTPFGLLKLTSRCRLSALNRR